MDQPPHQSTRILSLDGLRAVAVLLVFTTHVGILDLGWIGVSLFFVLSGLLITGILRKARRDPSYWIPFYLKRSTRILPPLLIAFAAAIVFSSIPWRRIGLYEVFFAANVAEAKFRGQSNTLFILWSLAIEEQFYFVWPFAVRFLNRITLIRLTLAIILASPILRAIATPLVPSVGYIFYLTPFQLDGLALGGLLALLLEDPATTKILRRVSGPVFVSSLGLFTALSFDHNFRRDANTVLFNSLGYTLIYVASASTIIFLMLRPLSLPSHLLSRKSAVILGTVSYGFYLFHPVAILLVARLGVAIHFDHRRTLSPLSLLFTILFSWLSFRWYESPIICWGRGQAHNIARPTLAEKLAEDRVSGPSVGGYR